MKIIIVIIALIIIILLQSKKDYKELLVFLAISLIIDWIFVNVFSTVPFIKTITVLVGEPILSLLTYVVIELICMGIFYYVLQKYNHIISIIVYLIINLVIDKFYMTISGSVLIDLVFNLIIGIIILIVYKKDIKMEDIKYFAIAGIIINTILKFLMSCLWKIIGVDILINIWIFGTLFLPYIIGVIVCAIIAIIICLIRKKIIIKDNKFTILLYAIIMTFSILVATNFGYSITKYLGAAPDKVYTEMKEINDNERLIGLSKEQVIQLLGKPRGEEDKDVYYYDAGKITNYLFFGERDFYELKIIFDENDKVKYTSIKEIV